MTTPISAESEPLQSFLRRMAMRYAPGASADETLRQPTRLVAHLMSVATYRDVCELIDLAGPTYLRTVLAVAPADWLTPRAWRYWQRHLGFVIKREAPIRWHFAPTSRLVPRLAPPPAHVVEQVSA